jgi:AraC-like DNA-binding protein
MTENALFLLPALRRARDLIDRDYAEALDLDAMAGEAGYSRFHFARAFAAAYGETPRTYLTRRRIERAKTLLRTANLSVTEICFLVGFSSLGSFSARFRELVGVSPTEYRDDAVARTGVPPIPGCMVLMWTRPHPQDQQSARSPTDVGATRVVLEPQPKEHR